jgi:hypothetical protein
MFLNHCLAQPYRITIQHVCNITMEWPRYRRVISLEIQVGITSQINKWANTDPRKYRRWDQVPRTYNVHKIRTKRHVSNVDSA